jgi:hypothetical protein
VSGARPNGTVECPHDAARSWRGGVGLSRRERPAPCAGPTIVDGLRRPVGGVAAAAGSGRE